MEGNNVTVASNIKYITGISQYVVDLSDDILMVDTTATPVLIILPNILNAGLMFNPKTFFVNDFKNNAKNNNITISAVNNTVNAGTTVVLSVNGVAAECLINGQTEWLINGGGSAAPGSTFTAQSGYSAYNPGGQANATLLTATSNRIDTASVNAASVKLQPLKNGDLPVKIVNNTAVDINIFPAVGELFLNQAINTPFLLASGNEVEFTCYNNGVGTIT